MCCFGRALTLLLVLATCSTIRAQVVSPDVDRPPDRAWTLEDAIVAALAQHPLVEAARAHTPERVVRDHVLVDHAITMLCSSTATLGRSCTPVRIALTTTTSASEPSGRTTRASTS